MKAGTAWRRWPLLAFSTGVLSFLGGLPQPAARRRVGRSAGYSDRVFEDLFDEEDSEAAEPSSFRQSKGPRRQTQEEEEGEEDLNFDPALWDDLEVDGEEEEEEEPDRPGTEAELMETVRVSDEEVDEFLAEFNSKPILQKEPGTVPVDPFEKDASLELDTFKEVRSRKTLEIYGRGMPNQQMVITLKDRIHMLQEHAQKGEWQEARWVMKGIWKRRHLRLPLGRLMWNQMIKAHVNANRPKAAESWLQDMMDRIFQPDVVSYNTLLRCYGQRGEFLKAEKWMRRMRARGVEPDMYSYGALVQSYIQAEDLPGAERALQAMIDSECKIVPSNTFAHNALMKHWAQAGEVGKAVEVFEGMKGLGIGADATSYLHLMRACGHAGDPEGAAEWLKEVPSPGPQHFHAVMSAHAKLGDMEGAEAWFRVMMDAGLRPDLIGFNILLSAAVGRGDTQGAEGVLMRLEDMEMMPDAVTLGTLLSVFAKAGNSTGAIAWLLKAEEVGVEPDLNCYKQVIKACVDEPQMAEKMARRLLRNRLTPDVYTYNLLLHSLARAGFAENAEFWVDHLQRSARWRHMDFPLDQVSISYSEVLLAHARSDLAKAEAWLEQMLGEGIEPQARCYTALVQGYVEQGDFEQAGKWLARMTSWSNHQPSQNLLDSVETKRLQAVG